MQTAGPVEQVQEHLNEVNALWRVDRVRIADLQSNVTLLEAELAIARDQVAALKLEVAGLQAKLRDLVGRSYEALGSVGYAYLGPAQWDLMDDLKRQQ